MRKFDVEKHKKWFYELLNSKTWYHKLWFWKLRPLLYNIKSEVGSWSFRIQNGFDARDIWSLDHNIAKYALPRLKYLRQNIKSYPSELTYKRWCKIVDKMIYSFSWILDKDYLYDRKIDKKIQEGLDLFGKYFRNLWD